MGPLVLGDSRYEGSFVNGKKNGIGNKYGIIDNNMVDDGLIIICMVIY